MSDKETAPTPERFWEKWAKANPEDAPLMASPGRWFKSAKAFAEECTAQAPTDQERDLYALLRGICEDVIDWMATLSYDDIGGKEVLDHPLTKEIRLKLQRMYDHPLDNKLLIRTDQLERILERATPQGTPCDHFWRTIAVTPRWSWFTECEKCKMGAPLELQAENYVEDAPQGTPTPDPFSKCYKHREGNPVSDACGDGKHSQCTQDYTKCHCTSRGGHTVPHAYAEMGEFSPRGTPDTQWIKPKFPATTPEEWREFGKALTSPDQCPRFPIGKCKKCGKEVPDEKRDGQTILFCSYECYCMD